jgi:hypothetical protein
MTKLTCFDKKDEEKLARGWPNVMALVDGSEKTAARSALKAFGAIDPVYFTEWPRQVLPRYLRAKFATPGAQKWSEESNKLAREACGDAAPLAASDAIAGLKRAFVEGDDIYPFQTEGIVYGVETIAGTDAVLDAITALVHGFKGKEPSASMINMTATLGFLLLRASPTAAKKARATLEKAHAHKSFVEAIDLSLHGVAAVRRSLAGANWAGLDGGMGLIGRPELEYCDDGDVVALQVKKAKSDQPMSVRVAWLGGTETLANLASRKWMARQLPSIVRDFGMIRAPEVVELILSLVGKSSVKDAPITWFRAHADYVKPILAKSKSEIARGVLRQLG